MVERVSISWYGGLGGGSFADKEDRLFSSLVEGSKLKVLGRSDGVEGALMRKYGGLGEGCSPTGESRLLAGFVKRRTVEVLRGSNFDAADIVRGWEVLP